MWVKFQTHGKPGGLPAADWVSFIKQKQSKVRSQQFDVRGLKKVNHATKISKPAERALSRSSVTLSDVNAARSPSKQHRSVSVHLFKCFGGSITTLASFPSHFFFKNPRQLLSDRTPRLSFLKGKKKPSVVILRIYFLHQSSHTSGARSKHYGNHLKHDITASQL